MNESLKKYAFLLLAIPFLAYSGDGPELFDLTATAEIVSEQWGVPVSVAKERLEYQSKVQDTLSEIRTSSSGIIASSWFGDFPQKKLFVRFYKGTLEKDRLNITKELHGHLEGVIISEDSIFVPGERRIAHAKLREGLQMSSNDDFELAYKARTNMFHITIYTKLTYSEAATAKSLEESFTSATKKELPSLRASNFKIQYADPKDNAIEFQSLYGGGRLDNACGGAFITSQNGILTAGHCREADYYTSPNGTGTPLFSHISHVGLLGDYAHYRFSTSRTNPHFYKAPGRYTPVLKVAKLAGMERAVICVYGTSSRSVNCRNTVDALESDIPHPDGSGRRVAGLTSVHWPLNTPRTSRGDSGSPWYESTTAYGLHVAQNTATCKSYFMSVDVVGDLTGVRVRKYIFQSP